MSITEYIASDDGREAPTNTHVGTIDWDEGVAETKAMVAAFDPWRIAEIADLINPIYGAASMEKFAEATGVNYSDLKKYRTTRKMWPVERGRPSYAVAQALSGHPHRYKIAEARPNLTRDDAREIMAQWKSEHDNVSEATVEKVEKKLKNSFAAFLAPDSKMSDDINWLSDSIDAQTIDLDLLEEIRAAQRRLADALTQMETRAHTIDGVASEDAAPATKSKKTKKTNSLTTMQ